jgi:hypothetical protein
VTAIRLRLKTFTWLALVTICGLALGPSISRALAATHAADAMSLGGDCPVHSHLAASLPGHTDHPGGPSPSPDSLDCCGLCAVAASPLAAIDPFVSALVFAEISSVLLLPGDATARSAQRTPWSAAAPRGPPPRA